MPRYKLTIEYDGTDFCGWQRQDDRLSVQGAIEKAASEFVNAPVELTAAGRTDAGVHARGQVAHIDLPVARSDYSVRQGINTILLPHPISVLSAEEVPETFHARFSATKRYYLYRIVQRPGRLALDARRAWHIPTELDLGAMQEAASLLVGQHDFTSFRSTECQSKSPVKTLDRLIIKCRTTDPSQIMIRASARSFLHHQVRNMVGTLSLVGLGKWKPEDVAKALDARDRKASGPTAPAHGLYLMKVDY